MENRFKKSAPKPLAREEWLARALELLSRRGVGELRIDSLVSNMGVTKGSFYWHFRGRGDFVKSLVDYWAKVYTLRVGAEISQIRGSAQDRLLALMELLARGEFTKYNLPIRVWATLEPGLAPLVKKVDRFRLAYVRSLFKEMGFRGRELEMRTRTFVCFESLEVALFAKLTRTERLKQMKIRHAFFTRP